jgi:sulfite exporter TauE/SafE
MVYVAIAAALTTTDVSYSVVFMAMFGAGTLPAMMIVGYFGRMASLPVRNMFRKAVPVFMVVMAVILILRGLNLGIPFISPMLNGPAGETVICHP